MKFTAFAAAVLVCAAAAAAHAQGPGQGLARPLGPPAGARIPSTPAPVPAPAVSAVPARSCVLVTQDGGQYAETPLTGFDPAVTTTPLPAVTAAGPVMVVCNRTTIVPEITDYRVLTELRLPLSIKAGAQTLFLGASGGKLQAGTPGAQLSAEDNAAVRARLDQMEAAMQAGAAKK